MNSEASLDNLIPIRLICFIRQDIKGYSLLKLQRTLRNFKIAHKKTANLANGGF